MLTDVEYPPEQTAASLVNGILGDLQQLVDRQFQLTRREIETATFSEVAEVARVMEAFTKAFSI